MIISELQNLPKFLLIAGITFFNRQLIQTMPERLDLLGLGDQLKMEGVVFVKNLLELVAEGAVHVIIGEVVRGIWLFD